MPPMNGRPPATRRGGAYWLWGGLGCAALLTLFLCCLGGALAAVAGDALLRHRALQRIPPPTVPAAELVLQEDALPPGWRPQPPLDRHMGHARWTEGMFRAPYHDVVSRHYSWCGASTGHSVIDHAVARYRRVEDAQRDFQRLAVNYLQHRPPWSEMEALLPADLQADEVAYEVAEVRWNDQVVGRCIVTARYGRYVSQMLVGAYPGEMTAEEVRDLILHIDETFAALPDN